MATCDVDSIVEKVRAGDLDAFGEIVAAFQADVWRSAAPILADRTLTQDVVQQAFLAAYRNLDKYRAGTDFSAWVRTIARNLARNAAVKRARGDSHLEAYRIELVDEHTPRQWREDMAEDRSAALRHCREALPPDSRRMLTSYYQEGLPIATIAKQLNRSIAAVRQSLWRIRMALRDCIEKRLEVSP